MIRTAINNNLEFAIIGNNIFDEDAREPSPYSALGTSIPNDFPLAGRGIFAEIKYHINTLEN